ncbi:MAG: hypothetical protein ABI416_17140 [Ginsengibacter sp.]
MYKKSANVLFRNQKTVRKPGAKRQGVNPDEARQECQDRIFAGGSRKRGYGLEEYIMDDPVNPSDAATSYGLFGGSPVG